jgi:hypothetical protein
VEASKTVDGDEHAAAVLAGRGDIAGKDQRSDSGEKDAHAASRRNLPGKPDAFPPRLETILISVEKEACAPLFFSAWVD